MVDELHKEDEVTETPRSEPETAETEASEAPVAETAEAAEPEKEAEPEKAEEAEEKEEPIETMEEMMQHIDDLGDFRRGKVVEGTIVDTRDDGWLVDVGYKCEGFLPRKEWSHRVLVEETEEPGDGAKVQVQITNIGQGEDAQLSLSRWRCEFDERWNKIEEDLADTDRIEVKGLRKVKGGLIVNCDGIEGFVPISHLGEEGRGVNPATLVEETFPVKLLEKDRRKRRLVFSRRSILEEEKAALREAFYAQVNEGDELEGVITSITTFGVFVNLGAMEGLVHVSELSWQRNVKPKDVATKGETVRVKVIGIDQERNRVSLSIKQTIPDPWDTVSERWSQGMIAEGTVTNLTDFGAFVEIEPGIEGLVHIGDLSWTRIKHPKEVLKRGEKVEVSVLNVDQDRKRISLGYKQLNDPWKNVSDKYERDQEVPVKVVRIADFGAFVEIEEGIEGLIHISQLSRERVEHPKDVLTEGQEVTARILEVNPTERRIRLSLRPAGEEYARRRPRDGEEQGGNRNFSEERPRRRRSEGGRRDFARQNPQLPQEEVNVTIGDLLQHAKDAEETEETED